MRALLLSLSLPSLLLAAPLAPRPCAERLPMPAVREPRDVRCVLAVAGVGLTHGLRAVLDRDPGPCLDDLRLFPSSAETDAVCAWGERHLEWVQAQRLIDPSNRIHWRDYANEVKSRLRAWRCLHDAYQTEAVHDIWDNLDRKWREEVRRRPDACRLADLSALRDRIGWQAYRAGQLPFPARVEWFASID